MLQVLVSIVLRVNTAQIPVQALVQFVLPERIQQEALQLAPLAPRAGILTLVQ